MKVKNTLENNNIRIWLAAGYIDDMRYLTNKIDLGYRWSEEKRSLEYREAWKQEEEYLRYTKEYKTSGEMRKIMNSVLKEIEFTTETVEEFENARIPTLDFTMWVETGEACREDTEEEKELKKRNTGYLLYSFYEKPMASRFCIMESSAMSENMKRSILAQKNYKENVEYLREA